MNIFYISIIFGLINVCQKVTPQSAEDVGSVGYTTLNAIKEISSGLSELNKDKNGVALASNKFNRYAGKISKIAGSVGAIFAVAGVLMNLGESAEHKEIMNEFKKINEGLDYLGRRVDLVVETIRVESAIGRVGPLIRKVQVHSDTFMNYLNMQTQASKNQIQTSKEISSDIRGLLKELTEPLIHQKTWPQLVYESTYGNYNKILEMKAYIQQIVLLGITAFTHSCTTELLISNIDEENATTQCQAPDLVFEEENTLLNKHFEDLMTESINSYEKNIERRVEREMGEKKDLSHAAFADHIVEIIDRDYFWIDAVVTVYADVHGPDKHWTNSWWKFRYHGRNIAILMQPKSYDRNPFTSAKDVTAMAGSFLNVDRLKKKMKNQEFHAQKFHDFLKSEINEDFKLTVVRDWKTPTEVRATKDNTRFLYQHMNLYKRKFRKFGFYFVAVLSKKKSWYVFDKFNLTYGKKICDEHVTKKLNSNLLPFSQNYLCDFMCSKSKDCKGWSRNKISGTCHLASNSDCIEQDNNFDSGIQQQPQPSSLIDFPMKNDCKRFRNIYMQYYYLMCLIFRGE